MTKSPLISLWVMYLRKISKIIEIAWSFELNETGLRIVTIGRWRDEHVSRVYIAQQTDFFSRASASDLEMEWK